MLDYVGYKIDRFRFYIRLNHISTQLMLLIPLVFFLYEKYRTAWICLTFCIFLIGINGLGIRGKRLKNCLSKSDLCDLEESRSISLKNEYENFRDIVDSIDEESLYNLEVVDTSKLYVHNYIKYLIYRRQDLVYKRILPSYIFILLVILFTLFPEVRTGLKVLFCGILFGLVLWLPIFFILVSRSENKEIYENVKGDFSEFEEFEILRQFNSGEIDTKTYDKYMKIESKG